MSPTGPSEPLAGGGRATKSEAKRSRKADEPGPDLNGSIASAVRSGYEVVEKNIAQARESAQKFRQGELSASEVSSDARQMLRRAVGLGRQTAAAWFDLAEYLLDSEWRARKSEPASDRAQAGWPPFSGAVVAGFYSTPPPRHLAKTPTLEVQGTDPGKVEVLERRLQRTSTPLDTAHMKLQRLGETPFIEDVTTVRFARAANDHGVVADLEIKASANPGIYSASIWQTDSFQQPLHEIGLLKIKVL